MRYSMTVIATIVLIMLFTYSPSMAQEESSDKDFKSKQRLSGETITDLLDDKVIEVEIDGVNIEMVIFRIRRLVDRDITVLIPAGTFLDSKEAAVQDMVTVYNEYIDLDNTRWEELEVRSACVTWQHDIPISGDEFILLGEYREDLVDLMIYNQDLWNSAYAIQAAVWIIIENSNWDQIGYLEDRNGRRVIFANDVGLAMWHVDQAGIDITRFAIWNHRNYILRNLEDDYIADWLEEKIEEYR